MGLYYECGCKWPPGAEREVLEEDLSWSGGADHKE